MPSLNWIVSDIFLDNPRLRHRQNAQDQCLVMRQITFSSPRAKVAARSSLIRKKNILGKYYVGTLDILFRKIITFIKVHMAFVFDRF